MLKFVTTNNCPYRVEDVVGLIPYWLDVNAEGSAKDQLNKAYPFGGWRKMTGFRMGASNTLLYPDDPPMKPWAQAEFRDELILVYPHQIFAIVQPDGSFEAARLD